MLLPTFPIQGGACDHTAAAIDAGNFGANCSATGNYNFPGKVGIGTTSPAARLEVHDNNSSGWNVILKNLNITGGAFIGIQLNTDEGSGDRQRAAIRAVKNASDSLGGDLVLMTRPGSDPIAERMRIDRTGNVGIGTTSPDNKLHVMDGHIAIEAAPSEGKLKFRDSTTHTTRNEIYRDSSDVTILRNWNQDYTILKIWAPTGAVVDDREATLALARGDNNDEMIDVFNNGYVTQGDPFGTQYGIRSHRRQGTGEFRDFVFDQWHIIPGNPPTPVKLPAIMVLKPTRKIGIGVRDNLSARLNIRGDFTAKGTVTVQAGSQTTVTGTGTLFTAEINVGDKIKIVDTGETRTVTGITSDTSLTVDSDFTPEASSNMTVINNLLRLDDSSGTAKVFVNDQGNVGIGTTSPKFIFHATGGAVAVGAPNAAPTDADLNNSNISFWIDESGATKRLKVRVKLSDGTLKTATIDLA